MTIKIKSFKEFLIEKYEFESEDAWYDYHENIDQLKLDIELDVYNETVNFKPGDRISWSVVPSHRAKKIWSDYGKLGFVRDEKGIEKIKNILISNIIKLHLCNAILGHDTYLPQDTWKDRFEMTEEEYETVEKAVEDYHFFTYNNADLISDYGLPVLLDLLPELYHATDSEEILRASDKIFNVVHQRSDLAGFFIEGGSNTLYQMSGEGLHENKKI